MIRRYYNWRRRWDQDDHDRKLARVLHGVRINHSLPGTCTAVYASKQCRRPQVLAVLLSVIGGKTYNLLRSLLGPAAPGDKSYEDIVKVLKEHFEPKPSVITERFHFHRRMQVPGKSVADYVAELKRLATHCEFGDHLEENLRD